MPSRLIRATLALLLLAIAHPAPAPAADSLPDARALVDSVAAHYRSLSAYHVRGVSRVAMLPDSGGMAIPPSEAPFVFAARWPSRVHNEYMNPNQAVTMVADGESLAVSALDARQFVVMAAPRVVPGQVAGGEFGGALQPLAGVINLGIGIASASDTGPDTVVTAAGIVNCRRIRLLYPPDTTGRGVTVLPRMLWIDPVHRTLWRDMITLQVHQAGRAPFTTVQSMRFVSADLSSGGPDTLYRIAPRAGMHRVERLGPAPPPRPAIVGKPSVDFTLASLAGTRVRLSSLRGKVVVLDFWATWCGPCRRWMPIVAKLEREFRGRGAIFFAVNERDTPELARAFVKNTGTIVPVLLDRDGKVGDIYGASSIPLTVVIGRNGKVVDALVGLHPEEDLREVLLKAGVSGL